MKITREQKNILKARIQAKINELATSTKQEYYVRKQALLPKFEREARKLFAKNYAKKIQPNIQWFNDSVSAIACLSAEDSIAFRRDVEALADEMRLRTVSEVVFFPALDIGFLVTGSPEGIAAWKRFSNNLDKAFLSKADDSLMDIISTLDRL